MTKSDERIKKAVALVEAQLEQLDEIVARSEAPESIEVAGEELRRWKDRTIRLVSEHIGPAEADILRRKKAGIRHVEFQRYLYVEEVKAYLLSLREALQSHPEEFLYDKALKGVLNRVPPDQLTPRLEELLRHLVAAVRNKKLSEPILVMELPSEDSYGEFHSFIEAGKERIDLQGAHELDILCEAGLLGSKLNTQEQICSTISIRPPTRRLTVISRSR